MPGRIKGAAFREFLRWYSNEYSHERLVAALAAAGDRVDDPLESESPLLGVLANVWYSSSTVHALLDELTRGLGPEERTTLADRASEAVMAATLHGIYKALFRLMATPERYAKYGPRLWTTYYDSGTSHIELVSSNRAVSTVRGWSAHHPFMCELNRGAARAIYGAMGCQNVQVKRVACVESGAAECRFVTTWSRR
jgi:hypothetical protein